MKRTMKSFRLREDTIREIKALKKYWDRWEPDMEVTETDIITWAIASAYHKAVEAGDIKEGG